MINTCLANPKWHLHDILAEQLLPPPLVSHLEWAKNNIVFTKAESPSLPGPYNEKNFPYASEILKAMDPDSPCSEVTLMASAQVIKTTLCNIVLASTMDQAPCNALYITKTEVMAKTWSKTGFGALLRNTAALSAIFPHKSREGGDAVLFKQRYDKLGSVRICGANSEDSLASSTNPLIIMDELSKWEQTRAGDPEELAADRAQAVLDPKILKTSTPLIDTETERCRITRSFESGTQERYEVPCPQCGHYHELEWENFEPSIKEDSLDDLYFGCPSCGFPITENYKADIVSKGKWVAEKPERAIYHRSFKIWAAYSPLTTWESIAERWIATKKKGNAKAEQVFFNSVLGRSYKNSSQSISWEVLKERAEESGFIRGIIPEGFPILTVGVDVQGDWVEWQARAFGANSQSIVVDFGKITPSSVAVEGQESTGHISDPLIAAEVSKLVTRRFKTATGGYIQPDLLAIDGGYSTPEVFNWVKNHLKSQVIMVRGGNDKHAPFVKLVKIETSNQTGKKRKYGSRFYTLNVHQMKLFLYKSYELEEKKAFGFTYFPAGMGDEFYQQMTSEVLAPKVSRTGHTVYNWVPKPGVRSEQLDCANYAYGAALNIGALDFSAEKWQQLNDERFAPQVQAQLDLEDAVTTVPRVEEVGDDYFKDWFND